LDPLQVLEKTISTQEKLIEEVLLRKNEDDFEKVLIEMVQDLETTIATQERAVDLLVADRSLKVEIDNQENLIAKLPEQLQSENRIIAENEEAVRLQSLNVQQVESMMISPLALPEQMEKESAVEEIVEPEEPTAFWLPDVVRESIRVTIENEHEAALVEYEMQMMIIGIVQATLPPVDDNQTTHEIVAERNIEADLHEIVEEIVSSAMEQVELPVELKREVQISAENDTAVELQNQDAKLPETIVPQQELPAVLPEEAKREIQVANENDLAIQLQNQDAEELQKVGSPAALELPEEIKAQVRTEAENDFITELIDQLPSVRVFGIQERQVIPPQEIATPEEPLVLGSISVRMIKTSNTQKEPEDQVLEILDEIIEEDRLLPSPTLLHVETDSTRETFEAPSSPSVHEDAPLSAPPSPIRTPSEREILIITPETAEIIPRLVWFSCLATGLPST
jgi:hypothetical protein